MEILSVNTNSKLIKSIIATGLFTLLVFGTQVNAASACKGLENSACNGASSCSWVDGYTRKDGKTVKSFCRTKATSKKATAKKANSTKLVANTKQAKKSGI